MLFLTTNPFLSAIDFDFEDPVDFFDALMTLYCMLDWHKVPIDLAGLSTDDGLALLLSNSEIFR